LEDIVFGASLVFLDDALISFEFMVKHGSDLQTRISIQVPNFQAYFNLLVQQKLKTQNFERLQAHKLTPKNKKAGKQNYPI